uniref:BTB domain-containing protein n=1 Tax=Oryza glumipatula TaxID=40148 RepID=A0A0E0BAT0_9ORYZ
MYSCGVSFVGGGGGGGSAPAAVTAGDVATGFHLLVNTPVGECIESRRFTVGGYRWFIEYYPNGKSSSVSNCISVYLVLDDDGVAEPVQAQYQFRLVNQLEKEQLPSIPEVMNYTYFSNSYPSWGRLIRKDVLEQSKFFWDDNFTIRCSVIVAKKLRSKNQESIVVPPSDIRRDFGDLLRTEDGADVTFQVAGELIAGHRCVLAARSSVFKAQILGETKDGSQKADASFILVEDMEPQVFKSLLTFIYTDSLPELEDEEETESDRDEEEDQESEADGVHGEDDDDDDDDDDNGGDEMWSPLLVAADRYDLQRLKLICAKKLCERIDASTVADTLGLAEKHHCRLLKEACFEFLKAPANLKFVLASDGLDHITATCPSVLKELLAKYAS